MLVVLITMLGPISGAHLNPAVSFVFWVRQEIGKMEALAYAAAQLAGAVVGVMVAHAMFATLLQVSGKIRDGFAQSFSEGVATFGLVLVILLTLRARPQAVATSVGLYITAAYWFTASTSFANPAVTLARSLTDTFSGIRPEDVAGFLTAQIVGAVCGLAMARALIPRDARRPCGAGLLHDARVTERQGDSEQPPPGNAGDCQLRHSGQGRSLQDARWSGRRHLTCRSSAR